MTDTCRRCPARLLWARMESGKRNPLDLSPVPLEDVLADHRGIVAYDPYQATGTSLNKANRDLITEWAAQGIRFHRSHFATCQAASISRRARRESAAHGSRGRRPARSRRA